MRGTITLLKETFSSWSEHNVQRMGAALAFYTALSLAPLVVLVVGITGMLVGRETVRAEVVAQFTTFMGQAGASTIDSILANPAHQQAGFWATIIGFVVVLIGASGVFGELQDSLNCIWNVPPGRTRWRLLLRKRILCFGMVFALGFLVLLSLLVSAVIAAVRAQVHGWMPGGDVLWQYSNTAVSFGLVILLFGAIFRYLPDVRIAWRDVWIGAALTGVLFVLGKYLLALYFKHSAFASAYGAAGSLLVVLVWVYYSAQIFFLGAEFTHVFARRRGSLSHLPKEDSREQAPRFYPGQTDDGQP